MTRMLRLPAVCERTGLSPTTIWRREKEGTFPRRRRIGPNAVGWKEEEVQAFLDRLEVVEAAESNQ